MAALLVQEDERESPLLRDFPEEASFEDEALAPVPNPALEGFRAQDLRVSSSPGPDVRDTSEASIRVGYSNGGCPWCVHFIYDEYYMANLLSVLNSSWEDITRGSFSKCLSRLRDPSEEMLALGGPCCLRLSRIVKFLRAGDFFCHVPCWSPSPGIQARTRVEESAVTCRALLFNIAKEKAANLYVLDEHLKQEKGKKISSKGITVAVFGYPVKHKVDGNCSGAKVF
ncbi:hypothetical protein JEQ12_008061 [Ovis aries]|uniref:Uncharacterized protein n=1 Tax=Ovis aries TaxID=9940 RepID=A0A836CWV7_SHEEP|nr:hypothetical protein JEQ12_008061 [Ovis aries]